MGSHCTAIDSGRMNPVPQQSHISNLVTTSDKEDQASASMVTVSSVEACDGNASEEDVIAVSHCLPSISIRESAEYKDAPNANLIIHELTVQRDRYKLMANAFRQQLTYGSPPRRNMYLSKKCEINAKLTEWSSEVHILYQELNSEFGVQKVQRHIEALSDIQQKAIILFIDTNWKNKNYRNPLIPMFRSTWHQHDILEKRVIPKGHRIPELEGKYGVFTRRNVPKNKVIGRYVGMEMTNKEWNDTFDYSDCDGQHGEYLFTFAIDEDAEKSDDPRRKVTIDPLEGNMMDKYNTGDVEEMLLLYINDIRKNILNPVPTPQDKRLQNCAFVIAKVYGWPYVFVITTKRIVKGQELFIDYGAAYSVLMKENKRWKHIIDMQKAAASDNVTTNWNHRLRRESYQID